jgi:hypothetical protein
VRWAGPLQFNLVAGSAGLAREITRAVRFRSARRDIQLQPGDLVLMPLAEWKRAVQHAPADELASLCVLDVAAVLVSGPGLETAMWGGKESYTPIMVLPETQLDDAETLLTMWLTSTQTREEHQANDLRSELCQHDDHADVDDMLQRVVQFTSKAALIHDARASVVVACQPAGRPRGRREIETASHAAGAALGQLIRQNQVPPMGVRYHELSSHGLAMLVAALHDAAGPTRYLSLIGSPAQFTHRDRIVLIAAADAATEFTSNPRRNHAEDDPGAPDGEYAPGVLRLLLLGHTQEACSVAQRAGYDLDQAWVGLAFGVEGGATVLSRMCQSIARLLRAYRPLLRIEHDCILGLVPAAIGVTSQWQRRQIVERWLAELSSGDATLRLGYTAVHWHAIGAGRAVAEARHALALSRRQEAQSRITTYAAACIRELVSGTHRSAVRRQLYDVLFRPLNANDHAIEHELLRTLSVHLDTGCRTQQTAELLGIHRNTVLYRLQRIAELTSFDLDDGDMRLLLQLVLRSADERAQDCDRAALDTMEPAVGLEFATMDVRWFKSGSGRSGLLLAPAMHASGKQ